MSQIVETNQENFKWGNAIDATSDADFKVYRSFTYLGVEYSLYDCVYLYRAVAKETDIGKLIKLWETKKGGKRGKILWFFRPMDIYHYLGDYEPSWNELFLASGQGKGVSNLIPLEAIAGKCNVVCISKDSRNTLPSKSDLGRANYYFSHNFNVGDLKISHKFPDSIDTIKVERLLNGNRDKPKKNGKCRTGLTVGTRLKDVGKPAHSDEKPLKVEIPTIYDDFEHSNRDQPKVTGECRTSLTAGAQLKDVEKSMHNAEKPKAEIPSTFENFEHHASEVHFLKKRKILPVGVADSLSLPQDTRRWFTDLPWGERVKEAHEHGALVHLVNLEPSYTSSDVQDIITSAFNVKTCAKIIRRGHFWSPSYGEALVIFQSKDDADFVMNELEQKCLIVGEERPLIAYKTALSDPAGKTWNFPGHLVMDSLRLKTYKRKGVFTSHCTQANTIEHEMANQWRILQRKSDLWWEALLKEQANENSPWVSHMKKSHQSVEHTTAEQATPPLESPAAERPPSASHPAS